MNIITLYFFEIKSLHKKYHLDKMKKMYFKFAGAYVKEKNHFRNIRSIFMEIINKTKDNQNIFPFNYFFGSRFVRSSSSKVIPVGTR